MKIRDLLRLPLGIYILTDGTYDYVLKKEASDFFKSNYCTIREYGSLISGSIALFEEEENIYDNTDLYKRKTYSISSFISGLTVHGGNNTYNLLKGLRFKTKTSYKEWISITNHKLLS